MYLSLSKEEIFTNSINYVTYDRLPVKVYSVFLHLPEFPFIIQNSKMHFNLCFLLWNTKYGRWWCRKWWREKNGQEELSGAGRQWGCIKRCWRIGQVLVAIYDFLIINYWLIISIITLSKYSQQSVDLLVLTIGCFGALPLCFILLPYYIPAK